MNDLILKTQEYLEYIDEHYKNVQKAWLILREKCSDMKFIYDDFDFNRLDTAIKNHDNSKLHMNEFQYYRQYFFPTNAEENIANSCYGMPAKEYFKGDFEKAWEHHKAHNHHHWQTWTSAKYYYPWDETLNCVHMLADWMAMSMKFGGTAKDYYEKNKSDIKLPNWAVRFIYEIFERVY